ncbi:MAG TPA: ATP-binding cassette domain-containing protein, partial [Gammaproteobacteria bacterium]|nr:ATP-binding cassette domain-containing protein [Gammaproteobacteria bacterium]
MRDKIKSPNNSNTNTPLIVADNLGKQVTSPSGSLTILEGISFNVAAGESLAVVGASGSGKTTLLGLLAGLDVPTAGRVVLNGQDLNQLDEDGRAALRAQQAGFVFQAFHLLPGMTALENVMLPLELAGIKNVRQQAIEILERVGLGERLHHYPPVLSGGEQQRVALARAFAAQPAILFADEPTGSLDTHTGERIIEQLFDLNQQFGTTLVMVTHDPALAERCDRSLHLTAGHLDGSLD